MTNAVTQLPDGSGFFTAEVMSKEEAMALPLNKRPLCYRISGEIYHAVFGAIGQASMCWKPRPGSEVFASEEASNIATDLCFKIANELEKDFAYMTDEQQQKCLCLLLAIAFEGHKVVIDAMQKVCKAVLAEMPTDEVAKASKNPIDFSTYLK
jgi:hypothetical protein